MSARQWIVASALSNGTFGSVGNAKRYDCESYARAAARDRQREKPFMSFVALEVPVSRAEASA